ncbi:MAG: alpha/beta hydrolase [Chloroflexota bacterium]|nr:alpha/beta hydrolase [Chloroflexota bacterium]
MSQQEGRLESKWVTVNGLSMHFRASVDPVPGDEPVVVLVHGLSVSSGYMVPTAVRLAPYYRVYAPDLPGFGKSTKPAHILTIAELADALAAWMQAIGLPSAVLIGNSLGCQIIVNFALRYPERITHAVLIGPTMDPRARTLPRATLRLLRDAPREPLSYMPVLVREYVAAGIRRTVRTLQSGFRDPMEEHLTRMHIPTLVVRGAHDPIAPQDWVEEVTRLLPAGQLVVVPGAGHAVNFNSPARLVNVFRSFMNMSEAQEKDVTLPSVARNVE